MLTLMRPLNPVCFLLNRALIFFMPFKIRDPSNPAHLQPQSKAQCLNERFFFFFLLNVLVAKKREIFTRGDASGALLLNRRQLYLDGPQQHRQNKELLSSG